MKKLLRTLQIEFPFLLDAKFASIRFVRNILKIPFEYDFRALSLFPNVEDALFLDVGANRGQSTDAILLAKSSIRIQLFEPNKLLFDKLTRLFAGNEKIVINNFGLGNENTEGVLFVPFYKKWMFDGLASFDEDKARNWLRGRILFYDDRFLSLHRSECEVKILDDLELDPFFIKLDIQGFEYMALKGSERTLRAFEPVLLIESPDAATSTFLSGLGYQPYGFRQGQFIPGITGRLNTFFMTEQKACLVKNHIGGQ